ncbi:hypothetical protein GIB67_010709 [Kingdonia uniflora]|uniref:Uncharacterized protein n=1 Tax=Kingdonia uniflora TaxID=39325 RepID=A0A7J7L8Q9_9MAGN|nr:hypothetical protein GIB67_010709 [Kingdonia uniflora]
MMALNEEHEEPHGQVELVEKFVLYLFYDVAVLVLNLSHALLVIAMNLSETDMQLDLVQETMKNHIEAPAIGAAPAIEPPVVGVPIVDAPVIGSSSSTTEIGAVVVRLQQVTPGKGLEVVKDLMLNDDIEVGREVNFKAISFEYDGDLLVEKVKSEEDQPQVAEEEDSEPPTIVVYYNGKKDVQHANETMVVAEVQTMGVAEVATTDIVFFNYEEIIGEAYQLVLMKSEVDATLKKRHALTKEEINERAFKMVINVYIKALIQYFDTQHRALEDKEKIAVMDVFFCQYIGRAFNVWTRNMSSPEGVELKKKPIWEKKSSKQWDRTTSNYINQ